MWKTRWKNRLRTIGWITGRTRKMTTGKSGGVVKEKKDTDDKEEDDGVDHWEEKGNDGGGPADSNHGITLVS
jgi:hypothetical protein